MGIVNIIDALFEIVFYIKLAPFACQYCPSASFLNSSLEAQGVVWGRVRVVLHEPTGVNPYSGVLNYCLLVGLFARPYLLLLIWLDKAIQNVFASSFYNLGLSLIRSYLLTW